MKKTISKQAVLNICIQMQEDQVANFENRVASERGDITNTDDSASQSEDRQAGKAELLAIYEKELAFSTADLQYLKSIALDKESSVVEPGALVVTKEIVFFISISTEKFEIDGMTVIGISVHAPIYKAMEGLGKGDAFTFNETEYLIEKLS